MADGCTRWAWPLLLVPPVDKVDAAKYGDVCEDGVDGSTAAEAAAT